MNKYLGNLVGAAMGDAMGAATEMRNRQQIEEFFGGYVRTFIAPPADTFARGNKPGQVTDDFSLAYDTCVHIAENNGVINQKVATEALLNWASEDNYYYRFAGPTTKHYVNHLRGVGNDTNVEGFVVVNDNSKATNGSAMKISPIALFSNGDIDKAIEDAITVASITHPNNISLSGAAAVAAATSCAMQERVSLYDILQAGLYGAKRGDEIGRERFKTLAGPSIERRMKLAIEIGLRSTSMVEAIDELADLIGSGLLAAEAVPAVFGIVAASKGDVLEGIYGGVNIGYDTDTVATMVGGILGAYCGADAFDSKDINLLETVNNYQLRELADKISRLGHE